MCCILWADLALLLATTDTDGFSKITSFARFGPDKTHVASEIDGGRVSSTIWLIRRADVFSRPLVALKMIEESLRCLFICSTFVLKLWDGTAMTRIVPFFRALTCESVISRELGNGIPARNLVFSLARTRSEVSSFVRVNKDTGIPFLAIWIANVVPQVVVPITAIFSMASSLFMDPRIFVPTCARSRLSVVSSYHDVAKISLNLQHPQI